MRVLRYGTRALLLELPDHQHALAWYRELDRDRPEGVIDLVPAARTLLITLGTAEQADAAAAGLSTRTVALGQESTGAQIDIPVVYDGPDLAKVAELTGLTPAQVIDKHADADYLVAFVGFSPGFGYLTGLDRALHVARRDSPRTRVPAGAVAIAGEFSAVYPQSSPGGWRLLGHTEATLWQLDRQPPALLQPGARVRFRPVRP